MWAPEDSGHPTKLFIMLKLLLITFPLDMMFWLSRSKALPLADGYNYLFYLLKNPAWEYDCVVWYYFRFVSLVSRVRVYTPLPRIKLGSWTFCGWFDWERIVGAWWIFSLGKDTLASQAWFSNSLADGRLSAFVKKSRASKSIAS